MISFALTTKSVPICRVPLLLILRVLPYTVMKHHLQIVFTQYSAVRFAFSHANMSLKVSFNTSDSAVNYNDSISNLHGVVKYMHVTGKFSALCVQGEKKRFPLNLWFHVATFFFVFYICYLRPCVGNFPDFIAISFCALNFLDMHSWDVCHFDLFVVIIFTCYL